MLLRRFRYSEEGACASGPHVGLALVAITILTIAAFSPIFGNDFLWLDDPSYIFDNPTVARGLTLDGVAWAFQSTELSNWHPLAWISHMIDVSLFGLAPAGHHAMNLAIHLLSGLLLFIFLRRATGEAWSSLVVASIFLLHPLRVESVAWASERKDTLSVFFGLASLLAYERYVRTRRTDAYATTATFFILSLLSKATLVTLPFLLLLLDAWPFQRIRIESWRILLGQGERWGRLLGEKAILLPISIAIIVVNMGAQRMTGSIIPPDRLPFAERAANAALAYRGYIEKTLWPDNLSLFYPHPSTVGLPFPWGEATLSATLLIVATVLIVRLAPRRPAVTVGWLWFLGTLLPMIGLVQAWVHSFADRYSYFPSIGLLVALVFGTDTAIRKTLRPAMRFSIPLLLVALATTTFALAKTWKSTETVFLHAAKSVERNWLAYDQLSRVTLEEGRFDEAIAWNKKVLEIKADDKSALGRWGLILGRTGRNAEAARFFTRFSSIFPDSPDGPYYFGLAEMSLGRTETAEGGFLEALRRSPTFHPALAGMGAVAEKMGDPIAATDWYRKALALSPGFPDAIEGLKRLAVPPNDSR